MTLSFYKFVYPCRIRMTVYWECSVDNALGSEDCFLKKTAATSLEYMCAFPKGPSSAC